MAQFLSSCVVGHGGLVVVLLLHEGDVPKLEHSRDDLQHGCRDGEGEYLSGSATHTHSKEHISLLFPHLHMFSSGVKPMIAMESMVWVKFSESL